MNYEHKTVYMIRNPEGLFSTGGYNPNFTKKGKVWSSLGALKNHLVQAIPYPETSKIKLHSNFEVYKVCEIVAFIVITTPTTKMYLNLQDHLNELLTRKATESRYHSGPITIEYLDGSTKVLK